jgi:type IV pilus assembly protein PilE
MRCFNPKRDAGFTLVELLVVITILGIILVLAVPGYQDSVRRTRRADAKVALNQAAQRLERCYTQFGTYDDAGCIVASPSDSPEEFYSVVVVRTPTSYQLTATAQGLQSGDMACAALMLDHLGQRTASGSDPARCW